MHEAKLGANHEDKNWFIDVPEARHWARAFNEDGAGDEKKMVSFFPNEEKGVLTSRNWRRNTLFFSTL